MPVRGGGISPGRRAAYVCQECGYESAKWLGRCPACAGWNTLVEERAVAAPAPRGRQASPAGAPASSPAPITEIAMEDEPRVAVGLAEVDRVLGGGVVPGSLVLIAGDPGIGKSTLVLQIAQRIAAARPVLYVSGEESARQTKMRAARLGVDCPRLLVLAEVDLEQIAAHIARVGPALVIVDSIQTLYTPDLTAAPGTVGQIRECTGGLLRLAKADGGPAVLIVGHVTKEGAIAGPRVLEHMVDTVLYFEGERHHAYRLLRVTKNRFGSTNEIGIFEMSGAGLVEVSDPSALFLAERPAGAPGSVVVPALEGSRPLLLEVQALVTRTPFGLPRRTAAGVDLNRMVVLLAVLEKRAGLHLLASDVYVSVAGGVRVDEPAVDLGVALAVASSHRERPVDPSLVAVGEVGLGGEVRAVSRIGTRVAEAAKLGFRRVLLPRASLASVEDAAGVALVGVADIRDALAVALEP
jgi:DNA repair protein RadA/Sms